MRIYYALGLLPVLACQPGTATSEKLREGSVNTENGEADSGDSEEDTGEETRPSDTSEPQDTDDSSDGDDADRDGFTTEDGDCNDADPSINPDASESENGVDDDCDGTIDEGTNAYDDDQDGFSENQGDCNDGDAGIAPDVAEIPDDGIDNDCDGGDLSCANAVPEIWEVEFSAIDSCDWGQNGNMAATQGLFSARMEQQAVYTPPAGYTLCDVAPEIQKREGGLYQYYFNYDDAILMTYNDRLLFTSSDSFLSDLLSDSLGYIYDWSSIMGADILNGDPWEWGSASDVQLADGNAYYGEDLWIEIGNGKMDALNEQSVSQGSVEFGLVVFGDNDDWGDQDGADCMHSGLDFEVEVWLIEN